MMNWDDSTGAAAHGAWDNGPTADSGDFADSGSAYDGIAPEHISKHEGLESANTCHTCGQEGHFSRDCPERGANSGECYNCGEPGHNKADCTNERVEREFTGECRICSEVGHRAADCPSKPPMVCRRCKKEGHAAVDCHEVYDIHDPNTPILQPHVAWEALLAADADGDLDDFRTAFMVYCKSSPEMTFETMQGAFREVGMKTWLVAREQDVSTTHTIVNLQGQVDQEYVVSFQNGLVPRRAKNADAWPKTDAENMQRLEKAGFVKDRGVPKCGNCQEVGHTSKACPEEKREVEKPEIKCTNCQEVGHYIRDCPNPRVDRNTCRNCGQPGHRASDCTEPRSAENVECRKCEKMGHFSRDCPDAPKFECRNCGQEGHRAADCTEERKITCRNCNAEGHVSRDCPEPKNMANMQCRNCDQMGHSSRECTEPKDWSKVECRNCGEKGHGAGRCKNPAKQDDASTGGVDIADAGAPSGGWEDTAGAGATATGGWDSAPTPAPSGAVGAW